MALARQRNWPYLEHEQTGEGRQRRIVVSVHSDGGFMAQPISTQQEMPSAPARGIVPAIVVGGGGLGAAILFGALVLWFHYGTEVFFEMIASGIAACF